MQPEGKSKGLSAGKSSEQNYCRKLPCETDPEYFHLQRPIALRVRRN